MSLDVTDPAPAEPDSYRALAVWAYAWLPPERGAQFIARLEIIDKAHGRTPQPEVQHPPGCICLGCALLGVRHP